VPLSLAIATSARVSFWLGAGDPKRARQAIRSGFKLALGLAVSMAAVLLAVRVPVANVYTADRAVAQVAAGLLGLLAVYHLGDAAQAMCVFVLRCYRVAVAPLLAYSLLLWGIGLAGGYALAYRGVGNWAPLHSPGAFWMAAAGALALLAVILPAILWRAVRAYRPA
jgi:MATE family multidrug resistance protein